MARTHLVPKGTMPTTPIDMGRVAQEHHKIRQPVKSIRTVKTPTWLRAHRAGCGLGYHKTFK
jgi:hypothetical protein